MTNAVHTPKQLGSVLRGQRMALGLTQEQAGAVVGLLPKTISKLELDAGSATIESLFKLISALQLELVVRSKQQQSTSREW